MAKKQFLTRGRFVLWLIIATAADVYFTYTKELEIKSAEKTIAYENNPIVSNWTNIFGSKFGFAFALFETAFFVLVLAVYWNHAWRKRWFRSSVWSLVVIKTLVVIFHLLGYLYDHIHGL